MFEPLRNALLLAAALHAAPAAAGDADAILKQVDAFRLPDTAAQVDTRVQTFKAGRQDKEKRYQVLTRPGGKALVLFRSPGETGQKVLMAGDDFWMVLPGSVRPIRITPLQKLLGEAAIGDVATMRWSGDFSADTVRETEVGGLPCLELELRALRPALSYQRIVLQVTRRDFQPVHADLFAASNRKLKQVRFVVEAQGGRPMVTRMTLSDEIQAGHETVVSILGRTPRELADALFNPMFLGRGDGAPP